MNVIFLDVDGVLNCWSTQETTANGWRFVEDRFVKLLADFAHVTDAKIVLSSDWREGYKRMEDGKTIDSDLIALSNKLNEFNIPIYSYTPIFVYGNRFTRESEVHKWLEQHDNVEHYVIFDDYWIFPHLAGHFVQTDEAVGLTEENIAEAYAAMAV